MERGRKKKQPPQNIPSNSGFVFVMKEQNIIFTHVYDVTTTHQSTDVIESRFTRDQSVAARTYNGKPGLLFHLLGRRWHPVTICPSFCLPTQEMDALRKAGARWRSYSVNVAGWFSQPRKMTEWPSDKQLEFNNLMEACEENFGAATLEFSFELLSDKETAKLLPEKLDRLQRLQTADMEKADVDPKNEPYEKILDSEEELEESGARSQTSSMVPWIQDEEDEAQLLQERAEPPRSSACTCCGTPELQQKNNELDRLREKIQLRKLSKKERKRLRRTFWAELQEEREKKELLHRQLKEVKRSHLEECIQWKSQVEKLQQQLESELQQKELLQVALEELKKSLHGSSELQAALELQMGQAQTSCEHLINEM